MATSQPTRPRVAAVWRTARRAVGPAPFTLDPAQALASLDRIEGVDATWLLPGHGPAWDGGVPEAVRLIRETAAESRR